MSADRPICVLIGALGGQGGGVLADWLVEAAEHAGYPAQATSTPGVAQRTGATTYYYELFPEKNPPGDPVFTLFPATGDLDIMAALEPTEAGRAVERGFVTATTTVITGLERVYSTAEKMPAGDGRIETDPMMDMLENVSKDLIRLNVKELSDGTASRINAVMFGAIVGSGILPLTEDDGKAAIRQSGVAVESNLAGFDLGVQAAKSGGSAPLTQEGKVYQEAPADFADAINAYPGTVREIIGHGVAQLIDYQDAAYARLYLDRVSEVAAIDSDASHRLTFEAAKRIAKWMSFEDVVRVAQLKTRPGRLARIRGELGVGDDLPLKLTDYFKPGRDEFAGILPPALGWLVPNTKKLARGNGMALHIPTGSAFGFLLLKILAAMKPLRRKSAQYLEEQEALTAWMGAIKKAAAADYDLSCRTAELSILARGYGNVRREGLEKLAGLFANWENRLGSEIDKLSAEVDQLILLAQANPDAPQAH